MVSQESLHSTCCQNAQFPPVSAEEETVVKCLGGTDLGGIFIAFNLGPRD